MSFECLTGVINVGRIALRMTETDASILAGQQNVGFAPRTSPATYDPRSAFWNLDSLFVIEYAAHRIHPEFKITKG